MDVETRGDAIVRAVSALVTTALIAWELWFIVSMWRGGSLPVPFIEWHTSAGHPVIAVLLLVLGTPFLAVIGFTITALIAGPLVLAFGGKRRPSTQAPPDFARHISLTRDGKGATFEMRMIDGRPDWRWTYDSETPDNSFTMIATEQAITEMEVELGLPLTFSKRGTSRSKVGDGGKRSLVELERAAAEGDDVAQVQHWFATGVPVHTADELAVGTFYCLAFDLARYERSFTGRRWEGFPDLDDEPEVALWHAFEPAEASRDSLGKAGVRYRDSDVRSRAKTSVVVPRATQAEVERVFDRRRAAHLEWERKHPPRFHR